MWSLRHVYQAHEESGIFVRHVEPVVHRLFALGKIDPAQQGLPGDPSST